MKNAANIHALLDQTVVTDLERRLLAMLEEKDTLICELQQQVKSLAHQVDWFTRQIFGQKSEKRDMADNPYQTTIADVLKDLPELPKTTNDDKKTFTVTRGKAKKNPLEGSPEDSGIRFDPSVPVEEITLSAPELNGDDKDDYEIISYKTTYRLAQRPGSHVILKYTRPVVKKKSTQVMTTTAAPEAIFDKSLADVSFLVGMLLDKFLYHLPLYRQHQRLENSGIFIARSTLTNLVKRAIELLRPIYQSQLMNILISRILAIDETPIKAGKKSKGKLKTAYFWPIFGEMLEICFTFSASRSQQHLTGLLGDFKGILLSDGYSAYDSYVKKCDDATLAQCWAHTRRKFDEAEKSEPECSAIALAYIGKLYEVEDAIKEQGLTGKEKVAYRQRYAKPIVDAFYAWCYEQRQRIDLVKSDPFCKALMYAQNREHGLRVFLNEADLQLDTNHVERSLRVIPMGKKNWLFSWTEIGAEHIGIIQSLIVTCRMHNINPYDYLVDVLQRVDRHPASRIHELTPRVWKEKFADNPLRSDLFMRDMGLI
jgi:transposase